MIDQEEELPVYKQAVLLKVSRSTIYYRHIINDDSELANMISEIYLESSCRYGYRKITQELQESGILVNKKKVLRLMQEMNIQGVYPKRTHKSTVSEKEHLKYPYLLSDIEIKYPDQVWATDITYIKIGDRFIYLMAILDLFSRYVVGYELSNTLEATFCVDLLKMSLNKSKPEIFNTDQGVQFTCTDFVNELKLHSISISMDHKGRCFDNILVERFWRTVKQEAVYFYRPENIKELEKTIHDFIEWYNDKRLHASLGYRTPAKLYNG